MRRRKKYAFAQEAVSVRHTTWLGDAYGHHGLWVITFSDRPVALDVLQRTYERGYTAGFKSIERENPADFQMKGGSSPDLRLVTLWYEGFRRGRGERAAASAAWHARLGGVRRNPYTPPSKGFTIIEYRLTRRKIDGVVYLTLLELVQEPGEKPQTAVYTWHASRADIIQQAKTTIQNAARKERNSPNTVRLFDENGKCIYAARNKMLPPTNDPKWGLLGQRATPSWEEVPCAKPNPVGVFISDPDALTKLEAVEGADWLKNDRRMWEKYRSGNTAHAFVAAWNSTRHLPTEDSPYWKDYFAGETGVELGVIYGEAGWSRYAVTDKGEIRLDPGSTHPEKVARAVGAGFRVPK